MKNKIMKKSGSKTSNKLNKEIKKRGRRPKKIIDNEDEEINARLIETKKKVHTQKGDESAIFLRLNIDPSKLKNRKKDKKVEETEEKEIKEETSEGMFNNDIPIDNTCNKCIKSEKMINLLREKLEKYEKKDILDRSSKMHLNKLSFVLYDTKEKVSIKKTNIKCWWDSHNFTNVACFLPEIYHNNIYHITGCFCSFNCALAYNLYYLKDSKMHQRKSLIYKLYREIYGLSMEDPIDIKEAPPKEILEDFGGDMTITAFRRTFITINKEYIIYMPPMKPINILIEEKNLDNNDDNDKEYIIKRSKPLTKKKSILTSIKKKI